LVTVISDEDQLKQMQLEIERLESEVERFRRATEDCLQQLGWCIGYFAGSNKARLAKAIGGNVAYIRRGLLQREDVTMPAADDEPTARR
jgi:hypothetical protein